MIVLEGPDLVGKSSIANALFQNEVLQELGYIIAHFSRLPVGWRWEWYADRASTRLIQDRFHMSEMMYAKLNGKDPCMTPEQYRIVQETLVDWYDLFTVVITASEDLIAERYTPRAAEEMFSLEQILDVNNAYIEAVNDPMYQVNKHIHVDVTNPNALDHVECILKSYLELK